MSSRNNANREAEMISEGEMEKLYERIFLMKIKAGKNYWGVEVSEEMVKEYNEAQRSMIKTLMELRRKQMESTVIPFHKQWSEDVDRLVSNIGAMFDCMVVMEDHKRYTHMLCWNMNCNHLMDAWEFLLSCNKYPQYFSKYMNQIDRE